MSVFFSYIIFLITFLTISIGLFWGLKTIKLM